MAGLDDFLREVRQASRVEAVTLGTRASDELVQEGDGLLTGVLTLILHHTGLTGNTGTSFHLISPKNTAHNKTSNMHWEKNTKTFG